MSTDTKKAVPIVPSPMNMDDRSRQLATFVERGLEHLARYSPRPDSERQNRVRQIAEAHRLTCAGNDYLMGCSTKSHYEFIAFCVTIDLVPGKAGGGQMWAVPFKGTVTPIIGHKGYMALWHRGHSGDTFDAKVVYRGEDVTYDHERDIIIHKFGGWEMETEPKDIVGAYAQVRRGGKVVATSQPIRLKELLKRAKSSQSYDPKRAENNPDKPWLWFKGSSAWDQWYEEMLRKTAVRMFLSGGFVSLEKAVDLERVVNMEKQMDDEGMDAYAKIAGIEAPEGLSDEPAPAALGLKPQTKVPELNADAQVEYGEEDDYEAEMAQLAEKEKGDA